MPISRTIIYKSGCKRAMLRACWEGWTTMPKGPNGEWRPADPVACAVHVGRIATGEIGETFDRPERSEEERAAATARASKAGKARAAGQSADQRREVATAGAEARWRATS